MLDGCGADHQAAVCDGIGERIELLGVREQLGGWANGRAGLAKSRLERMDYAQMKRTEVAHGARSRAEIKRITRANQNDAQPIEW